jgi:hypothetical protein
MLDELSVLMVREGHRATNNDLAAYVKEVIEHAGKKKQEAATPGVPAATSCVVLAAEAFPPPRSVARPRSAPQALRREWEDALTRSGAEVWERSDSGLLAVWLADTDVGEALQRALAATLEIRRSTHHAGYRLAAGLTPGAVTVARGDLPAPGWELAGPFYLARWMMNLSAHRGRVLLTEVGARNLRDKRTELLGRIGIEGNKYINLYEVA